jgi:hypothetical protein
MMGERMSGLEKAEEWGELMKARAETSVMV